MTKQNEFRAKQGEADLALSEFEKDKLKRELVQTKAQLDERRKRVEELERSLKNAYTRLVTKGGLVNKDVSRFTVDRLTPRLRAELDRRIIASVNLIKFNREETISNTLRRFSGWATSIPPGGTEVVKRNEEKKKIIINILKNIGLNLVSIVI